MRVAVAIVAFSLVLSPYLAHPKTASEVFEQFSASVVVVEVQGAKGVLSGLGSGVVIAPGEVVTNAHVVKGDANLFVRHGSQRLPGKVRYTDWDRDICQLVVQGLKAPAASLGSTKSLKTGARVYAIGAPQGLELTMSEGIISSLRPVEGGQYIQVTAPISKGSSGGGLFDEEGRLIGLTSFYVSEGQNLNFAVPVEWTGELSNRHKATDSEALSSLNWFNKTVDLENRKDWPGLLIHCQSWIKAEPKSPVAWNNLGFAYGKQNQPAMEIEALQQALRINPDFATAWYNLGATCGKQNQPAKAIEAYQQALRINPDYAEAWINLGGAYVEQNQPAKAIEAYQQALRINPDDAEAWYNMGTAYGKQNQPAKAIEAYQQALRINPDDAEAWINLGFAYGKQNQQAKAIESYQQALRINPDDATAWYNMGITYAMFGNRARVMEVYRTLKTLDPVRAEKFFKLCVLP